MRVEACLIEFPDDPELGGPRFLGRTRDEDLVALLRERILAQRRRSLAELGGHLRPVRDDGCDG